MSTPMKDAVLDVMSKAAEAGRYPILTVSGPDKVTLKSAKDDGVSYTYDHVGCAAELGVCLSAMKAAGEWKDDRGIWSWLLQSKAGVHLTGGRAPKSGKSAPAPNMPAAPKTATERMAALKADLSKAEAEVQRIKTAIDDLAPEVVKEEAAAKAKKLESARAALALIAAMKDDPDFAALLAEANNPTPAPEPAPVDSEVFEGTPADGGEQEPATRPIEPVLA